MGARDRPRALLLVLGREEEVGDEHADRGDHRRPHQPGELAVLLGDPPQRFDRDDQPTGDERSEHDEANDAELGQHLHVGVVGHLGREQDHVEAGQADRARRVCRGGARKVVYAAGAA
jgi:hypothetical protein